LGSAENIRISVRKSAITHLKLLPAVNHTPCLI